MILTGTVRSGKGNFSYCMEKLQTLCNARTGVALYPGSLDSDLAVSYDLPVKDVIWLEKEAYGGRVSVSLLPCAVSGIEGFIMRPDPNADGTGDHPKTIVEVAAQVRLRDALNVSDVDFVTIKVPD